MSLKSKLLDFSGFSIFGAMQSEQSRKHLKFTLHLKGLPAGPGNLHDN